MTRLKRTQVNYIAMLAIAFFSVCAEASSPEQIDGAIRISAEELIQLAQDVPELVIIDSRVSANRKHGYIDGSLSLPDTDTDCESLKRFIATKTAPAAFYCNGVTCGRSAKAVNVAIGCGYKKIYWFRGGFEEWKEKNFPYLRQE